MRRSAALLLLLTAALVGPASLAQASVEEVVAGLARSPLYLAPTSAVRPDEQVVRAALERATVPVYIALVPQSEADAEELGIDGLLLRIDEQLARPGAVVLVVTDGQELQAGGGKGSGVRPVEALDRVLAARLNEPFTAETLTGALVDFADQVGGDAPGAPADRGLTRRTVGLVGLVAVAALTAGWLYVRAQRRILSPEPLNATSRSEDESGWSGAPAPQKGTVEP